MPLDVQPLTPARRAILLLVMLALLGASLGFAEFIVRHQKPPFIISGVFLPPTGVTSLPVNDTADLAFRGPVHKATAVWSGQTRTFIAFSFAADRELNLTWEQILDRLFHSLAGMDPPANALLNPNTALGGRQAMELWQVVDGEHPRFDVVRMTILEGHVIAFGFSGTGPITETDKMFFDRYCTTAVKIAVQRNSH
ncbi:MAG TPA: hypothetical protein VHM90_09030 [Phycisphaerae bacterium]|nr:hypothetical protein [Phycisphaerae bacterium]